MEKLIFIAVVVILSLLHSWWKKRHGEGDEADQWPATPPRRPPGAPPGGRPPGPSPRPAESWEEELRRLLEGTKKPTPPVATPKPPPLPAVPAPRPVRAPRAPVPVPVIDKDMETGLPVQMPSLTQSAAAYLRASRLEESVAARMQRIEQRVVQHKSDDAKQAVPGHIRQALGLLRERQSQRASIIASLVLGPPKSLEP